MWEYNTAYLGAANDAQILALFRKWAEAVRWLRRPGLAEVSVTWNLLPAAATIRSHSRTMLSARPIA
jgi:hypothetical protein